MNSNLELMLVKIAKLSNIHQKDFTELVGKSGVIRIGDGKLEIKSKSGIIEIPESEIEKIEEISKIKPHFRLKIKSGVLKIFPEDRDFRFFIRFE